MSIDASDSGHLAVPTAARELIRAGLSDEAVQRASASPPDAVELVKESIAYQVELRQQTDRCHRALRAAEQLARRYRDIFEQSPLPMLLVNPSTTAFEANAGAVMRFNLNAPYGPCSEVLARLHQSDRGRFEMALHDACRDGEAAVDSMRLSDPASTEYLCHAQFWLIEASNTLAVQFRDDVAASMWQEKANQAIRANRVKSEFLASMSHEIRTPIHSVVGFAKLILEDLESMEGAEVRMFLGRILEAGERQLFFVNDLLDLSKLEAGHMNLRLQDQDMGVLVREVSTEFAPLLDARHLQLRVNTPAGALRWKVDPERLAQIVRNLLSNALRFSPDGGAIDLVLEEGEDGAMIIRVDDRGTGIPEGELESIFDKFVQSSSTKPGGTGLGLAIARALAQLHGGALNAMHREGGGSTFLLTLTR